MRRTACVAFALIALLASTLGTAANGAAAATPPRLQLQVGGSIGSVVVLSRHLFIVDVSGFQPDEPAVIQGVYSTYTRGTVTVRRAVRANPNGDVLNQTFVSPEQAKPGWAALTVTGSTGRKARGRVYVAYRPSITLRPSVAVPGNLIRITGTGFVSQAPVGLTLAITTRSGRQTVSTTAAAGVDGSFSSGLLVPANAVPGGYNVTAQDSLGGFRRGARLTIHSAQARRPVPTPTATSPAPVRATVPASVAVFPNETLPNKKISVVGTGFRANAPAVVTLMVTLNDGTTRIITHHPLSAWNGTVLTGVRIPYRTVPGTYEVTVSDGSTAAAPVRVLPRSMHPSVLHFQQITLRHRTVRPGTHDVLTVQAAPRITLGIWTHIIFPSGKHHDYYKLTNRTGHWKVRFKVPRHSAQGRAAVAYITVQLWHGNQTTQAFVAFVVR